MQGSLHGSDTCKTAVDIQFRGSLLTGRIVIDGNRYALKIMLELEAWVMGLNLSQTITGQSPIHPRVS